jgi:NAD(P)-dependent dehydrogenase (short-subunit alcohol dehydrogenase family)
MAEGGAERVAIVTGGTRGIGEGVARALANQGWRVVVGSVSADEVAAFAPHEMIEARRLDVTDDASVLAFVGGVPRIDALVNCAGTLIRQGGEYDLANFEKVLGVNLVGTMRMCLAAKAKLAEAKGAIVNLASMYSFFGAPHAPAYSASKGGIAQLTKSLAVAWATEGIRVNAVAPGWIDTPLTAPAIADTARSAGIVARTPMGRWGKPEDAILPVDGGYLVT